MSDCTSTALRYLETLRAMPLNEWRTVAAVHRALARLGHKVTRRTVERDLNKLAASFGLESRCTGNGKQQEWMRRRSLEPSEPIVVAAPTVVPSPVTFRQPACRTILSMRRRRDVA